MNPIPIIMNLTGLGKIASTFALVAFLLLTIGIGKCAYDNNVIKEYEAGVQVDVIDATSEASAAADAEAEKYEAEFGKRQTQDRKEIENAKVTGKSPFDSWNVDRDLVSGRVQQPASANRKAAD